MSDKVNKLIRSVYPPQMVSRVKSLYRRLSPQEKSNAVKEMKKSKVEIKGGYELVKPPTPF